MVGVDVDQLLTGVLGGHQGVAVGSRLAEPPPTTSSTSAAWIRSTAGIWPVAEVPA